MLTVLASPSALALELAEASG
jgi:hypothetical protein